MAGEADNSEYWDALLRGIERREAEAMALREAQLRPLGLRPRPAAPKFGGYVAVPRNHADGDVFAWWSDGSIAQLDLRVPGNYIPLGRPDYATLFPASVAAPFVTAAPNATVGEGPRPLADQPRPDDADDTEYPRRRGRDD